MTVTGLTRHFMMKGIMRTIHFLFNYVAGAINDPTISNAGHNILLATLSFTAGNGNRNGEPLD